MKSIEHLGGKALTRDELSRVEADTGLSVPSRLASLLTSQPLVGLTFLLHENIDESGLGGEFKWMTVEQIIDESTNAWPGIAAARRGLLPVGICLEGSGDPYFLRVEDGAVVRVPHDAVIEGDLAPKRVELVAASLAALIDLAEITG